MNIFNCKVTKKSLYKPNVWLSFLVWMCTVREHTLVI